MFQELGFFNAEATVQLGALTAAALLTDEAPPQMEPTTEAEREVRCCLREVPLGDPN